MRMIFYRGKMWRVVWRKVRVGNNKLSRGGRREYKKYREAARALIARKIAELNHANEFIFNRIAIKNHKSRWGSCSKKGNLNFNYKIIFLPEHLAEYIVAHELCHLKEFNHSRKFWDLVGNVAPNYKQCLRALKKAVI